MKGLLATIVFQLNIWLPQNNFVYSRIIKIKEIKVMKTQIENIISKLVKNDPYISNRHLEQHTWEMMCDEYDWDFDDYTTPEANKFNKVFAECVVA